METSKIYKFRKIVELIFYVFFITMLFYTFIKFSAAYFFPSSTLKNFLDFDIQIFFSGIIFILIASFIIEVIFHYIIAIIESLTEPSDYILRLLFQIKVAFLIILFLLTILDTDLFNIFVGILSITALLSNLKIFYK